MSQAKVDAYKEEKANRKDNIKKDKRMKVYRTGIAACLTIALLGWVGFSLANNITDQQKSEAIEVNYDAISEYMNTLSK